MPRQARLDVSGALHHIMVRGINKSEIFKDDQDKTLFLERLGQNVIDGNCSVYAWVLMDNNMSISSLKAASRVSQRSCESFSRGTLNTLTAAIAAPVIYLKIVTNPSCATKRTTYWRSCDIST